MKGIQSLYRLAEVEVGKPAPMMLFPLGDWSAADYPELTLSQSYADEVMANFEADVLRTKVPVESDGTHKGVSPAAGWLDRLYMAPFEWQGVAGEALYADWTPNELGAQIVNDGEFAYDSVDICPHKDPVTAAVTPNVLKAVALTNRPVLRMMPGVKDAGESIKLAEEITVQLSEVSLAETVTKSEGDAGNFPAGAYAYVPDAASPSTWKLRLWATPTGGPDSGIVGDAVAALGKGFRGNTAKIPAADLAAVKAKVAAAWKKANADKSVDEMPEVLKAAETKTDPVAALCDKVDALLAEMNTQLKGKLGIPAIRTMLREVKAKASAHTLAEAGSTNDERDALQNAVSEAYGSLLDSLYVDDFAPGQWVIVSTWDDGGSVYYRMTYTNDPTTGIILGQPVEVTRDTTYVPVSDSSPAGAPPAVSTVRSAMLKATEGHRERLAEGDAAPKGCDHMDTKTLKALQLTEGASDEAVQNAVMKLAERTEAAETALAERDKADNAKEFTAKLAEAMKPDDKGGVHMLPGEKDSYLKLAELDHDSAIAAIQARIDGPATLVVGEKGTDKPGDADKSASLQLAETAAKIAAERKLDLASATDLALSENPELKARYAAEAYGDSEER